MIYFMQATDGGPVKIGRSIDVERRRLELEATFGKPLALLRCVPGGHEEERAIHRRFWKLRIGRTEQFRPAPELMDFIGRPLLADVNHHAIKAMRAAEEPVRLTLPKSAHHKFRIEAAKLGTSMAALAKTIVMERLDRIRAGQGGATPEQGA